MNRYRRRPMGYQRFKEFVVGKATTDEDPKKPFDEEDLPKRRPDGFSLLRARNSLLMLPFVHIYNKLKYTMAARLIGVAFCVALLLTGSWLAVMKRQVEQQERQLMEKNLVIAVMGKDDVEGMGRSDTLILVNVMYQDKKVNILSIPRDSRVPIRRTRDDGTTYFKFSKINHALRWGGVSLTKETVERYLGIKIDYHFIISYGLFVELIDIIGGVPIEVEKRMYYVDRAGGLTIDLRPGYQILDGNRSLQYVRFRHDRQGDIGRIARQQKFIKALAARVKSGRILYRLYDQASELLAHISTDIPIKMALLLLKQFRTFKVENLKVKTLPGNERALPMRPGGKRKFSFYVSTKKQVESTVNDWFLAIKEKEKRVKANSMAFPNLEEYVKGEEASNSTTSVASTAKTTITSNVN